MQLSKKSNDAPVQKSADSKKEFRISVSERAKYEEDYEAIVPHGKFSGRTYGYIVSNEPWYHNWLIDNNLLVNWGLLKLKDQQVPKSSFTKFISSTGEVWISIREHNQVTTPAPDHWYRG